MLCFRALTDELSGCWESACAGLALKDAFQCARIIFGLPFGCFLPKWQDFAITPFSTLSRIRVLLPTFSLTIFQKRGWKLRTLFTFLFRAEELAAPQLSTG